MNEFITLANTFGVPMALFIVAAISGAAGIWVWGWQYKAVVKERDEWREIAQKGQMSSERMLELFEKHGSAR